MAWNYLKISNEPISNMLITNMNKHFEDIVTKMVQMAHKVAQMTKTLNCVELTQN